MQNIHGILKEYWGYEAFRPGQEDIIRSVLDGQDTLALMPTGGGKSLCYQVPAMTMDGLCLVISPLIALMKDQVDQLRKRNITAYSIYSGMSRREVINTLKVAGESNCKFLFVSPERLETALFNEYLPSLDITLIAVDEAHCISQWGYDFRPPYLRIANLRDEVPGIPVLALTASATPAVQQDICTNLRFSKPNIIRQSFERPNLSYSVFNVDSKINKIINILEKVAGSSIVYCKTRKRTKEISDLLHLHRVASDYYHAGLSQEERSRKQSDWIADKTRVIVCTNAFGMGIDKPGVRSVIHADTPDCIENYYQEAGRAGRDGKIAYAVLLHDETDLKELEELAQQRYPSLEEIRSTYQSVANYLQIPAGDGEGQYYDFDITDFLRKFKLNSHSVLYSLKALEQEGWLAFNEQVFLPASVMFTTNKEYLYAFENEHTKLEPVIKALLRAYEGIFDHTVPVSEKVIAGLVRSDTDSITKQLQALHNAGILVYNPQKDTPQVFLPRRRIRAEDIVIDMQAYNRRKEQFLQRVKQMEKYVQERQQCRSIMIADYFGEKIGQPCGVCDNCIEQKNVPLGNDEFEALRHRIINMVKYETLHTTDLLQKLNGVKKEKAWKVLEYLQAENKINVDAKGLITLT